MKTLILISTMVAATFAFTRCVAGEGFVTAAKPTKSVLKSARPQYVARAQNVARAQVGVPAETPAAVEPAPRFPYAYGGHGYPGGGDPFAGTWWQGFWSEKHHGQSCWGGPHGGGGGAGAGGGGGRCGKFGSGCGKFAMGGSAFGKSGRCGRHCCACNECFTCNDGRDHQHVPDHQDAVPQPEPNLDSYFEPMDPPGFDGGASDIAPAEPPPMPEVPRRLSPPRNVLPKNTFENAVPSIDTAAKSIDTAAQRSDIAAKRIDSAVTHHEIEQTSAGTLLRFRGAPADQPVMPEPRMETADLLLRQTTVR